jgi:hypothetical protein
MRSSIAIASALLATALGCGEDRCPPCPQVPLVAGTYQTSTPGGPAAGAPASLFPWSSEPKTLEVDLQGRTVRLRYRRDGHDVVETWRIRALTECPL